MAASGTLYIVATPIGNLDDITLRAMEVLRRVDLIACEDTRRTRKLLGRHGIEARCLSHHKFNEKRSAVRILERLKQGSSVALVSDSGTPGISDPGSLLVSRAVEAGIEVRPVPGPNAAIAALSGCGLPAGEFTFRGFLPHRAGERRRVLAGLAGEAPTQLFYESPARVRESIADMAEILGDRRCCVVREMTKRFEQWYRGRLHEVAAALSAEKTPGEFCIIVEGAADGERAQAASTAQLGSVASAAPPGSLAEDYGKLLDAGLDRRAAIKHLAKERGLERSEVYRRLVEERARQGVWHKPR